jgi:hypothetical protein
MPETPETQVPAPRGVRIPQPDVGEYEMPHPIVARMALEILLRELASERNPGIPLEPEEEAVCMALDAMHDMLWRREMDSVADTALSAHYLIIRPVNPLNMPGPEEASEIAAAIATLDRHDLIARSWTDETAPPPDSGLALRRPPLGDRHVMGTLDLLDVPRSA